MITTVFMGCELFALLTVPLALLASCLAGRNWQPRLIVIGQVSSWAAASAGFVLAVCQPGLTVASIGPLRLDLPSSILLTGITFIASVVVVFSDRYLSAEPTRISFMRILSGLATCAAALCVSDSMILAYMCWTGLTLGLWYAMRSTPTPTNEATVVARYHLLSDAALLLSMTLIFASTGAANFSQLASGATLGGTAINAACLLAILAFGIKSALFPFHRWLLGTLYAPTPLSSLLHAGIVNVSAIVAWKMMPLLSQQSHAMLVWGLWSVLSAVVGTLSMSAQPDVKKKLVYSTVGQMGFMSLQCAVGAPGAAIFHLLAHGLFKCHLFLQSGSAVAEGLLKRRYGHAKKSEGKWQAITRAAILSSAAAVFVGLTYAVGPSSLAPACSVIAAAVFLSTGASVHKVSLGTLSLVWTCTILSVLLAANGMLHFEHLFSERYLVNAWMMPLSIGVFAVMTIGLQLLRTSHIAETLYVHSLNGFYLNGLKSALVRKTEQTFVS